MRSKEEQGGSKKELPNKKSLLALTFKMLDFVYLARVLNSGAQYTDDIHVFLINWRQLVKKIAAIWETFEWKLCYHFVDIYFD